MALTIRTTNKPCLTLHGNAIQVPDETVYIICASKQLKYLSNLKSSIIYIGETSKGLPRIAQSTIDRADALFAHGIKELNVYSVSCDSESNGKSWKTLEKDLAITFKSLYGEVPQFNTQFKNCTVNDLSKKFTDAKLKSVIQKYSQIGAVND